MNEYKELLNRKLSGWNTWNVRSMLSHVLMPFGFAINIGIKEYQEGGYLAETLLGRLSEPKHAQKKNAGVEEVLPGAHSLNGDYTRITVKWKGIAIDVETAVLEDDIFVKVMPISNQKTFATIVAQPGILWNKPGRINKHSEQITIENNDISIELKMIGEASYDFSIPSMTPYLSAVLNAAVYFYTGTDMQAHDIDRIIESEREKYDNILQSKGELSNYYQSIADTLAWNAIYDPINDTIKTIVGRTWSVEWGGYVQHCWDMYFNALMYAELDKDFAYNSAVEITKELTDEGFIPCCAAANGYVTLDRSQPPIGSLVVLKIYEKHHDKWFLEMLFDDLYRWNKWYFENRQVDMGVLGWGSKPYTARLDNYWETAGVGAFYGAAMESGLDNSPMYDDVELDPETHIMMLGDVGLTSLYIADTLALIDIAKVLNKKDLVNVLREKLEICQNGLELLWCEEAGIYLNFKTDICKFDYQLSPTNFYPLITGLVSDNRANRMINEHLLNENEFWGEWVLPSISKNNAAYMDKDYWRGPIWAPMNLLVYFGLKKAQIDDVASRLADKSGKLIMKEWRINRHIHENYCAITGEGCSIDNSEKFYSWGALLSYIYIDNYKKNID